MRAEQCKAEVCNALWGSGNPDVSGPGMAIGYVFEVVLTFAIIVPWLCIDLSATSRKQRHWVSLSRAANNFCDTSLFFTWSVQLASVVVTLNAGLSRDIGERGEFSLRLVWAISSLTLLLPALLLGIGNRLLLERRLRAADLSTVATETSEHTSIGCDSVSDNKFMSIRTIHRRDRLRIMLAYFCLIPSAISCLPLTILGTWNALIAESSTDSTSQAVRKLEMSFRQPSPAQIGKRSRLFASKAFILSPTARTFS